MTSKAGICGAARSFQLQKQFPRAILALAAAITLANASEPDPLGIWRTYDDQNGRPASLVQIENRNGQLEGRVVELFTNNGNDADAVCENCVGENKNRPIVGMKILWNMHRDGNKYAGGEILDPDSGNTYRCTMEVVNGDLLVRGYMGISLFGRTQTWKRAR